MAGTVHLIDQGRTAGDRPPSSGLTGWLETATVILLAAVALCAPLSTKGAVNCFRAATVLWLISLGTTKRKLYPQALAPPLIVFLLLTGISSAFSLDPFLSWGRMRTVSLILLAIVAGQAIGSMRQLKILTGLLIGSCLLAVFYTGWQYTAGIGVVAEGRGPAALHPLGLVRGDIIRKVGTKPVRTPHDLEKRRFSSAPVELLVSRETANALESFPVRVDPKALEAALRTPGVILTRAHPPRAQGFFKHYFPFSEILVFIGSLIGGFAVSGVPDPRLRIALIVAFVLTATALGLTLTRISLASLLVGVLVAILVGGTRGIQWVSLAAFLVIALAGIYWVQHDRQAAESDTGTEYRLLMWRDSIDLVRAHPFLGVGFDSVAGEWQRWNLEAYRRFRLHSHFHSTPIQLAVECGLPALAAWVWLIAGYAIFLTRLNRRLRHTDWFERGLVRGILGGLAGFVLTGFLQYNFGDAEAMVVFWLLMGLAFALDRQARLVQASQALASDQHPVRLPAFDTSAAHFLR